MQCQLVSVGCLPPGCLPTLWNAQHRFHDSYLNTFPGYYETGDAGYIDDDGYLYIMARTDDVINVAGHRLSTSAIEEVVLNHPDVVDAAVVGVPDAVKGQLPLILYIASQAMYKGGTVVTHKLGRCFADTDPLFSHFSHSIQKIWALFLFELLILAL